MTWNQLSIDYLGKCAFLFVDFGREPPILRRPIPGVVEVEHVMYRFGGGHLPLHQGQTFIGLFSRPAHPKKRNNS